MTFVKQFLVAILLAAPAAAMGQLAPEIGYMSPPGAAAGVPTEVTLGGYDWTPDMQVLVADPRIQIELLGPPSPVLVPDPPYWFGAKGRGPAWPLPREFKARLTIPPGFPTGLVRWQVANANGVSPPAQFHVAAGPMWVEQAAESGSRSPLTLPITLSGQIRTIEEIDRYTFQTLSPEWVTLELVARRIGSPLHAVIKVTDASGRSVVDAADTEGRDLLVAFRTQAKQVYTLSLHDVDFAGDRSYVYRLVLTTGPRVLATLPTYVARGSSTPIEFIGVGLDTHQEGLATLTRQVSPPANAGQRWDYRLETPSKEACVVPLAPTALPTYSRTNAPTQLTPPFCVSSRFDKRNGIDRYPVALRKGENWSIAAQSMVWSHPLDVSVAVFDAQGKRLAQKDDDPGVTDATLVFSAPTDGVYSVTVAEHSGRAVDRLASYALTVEKPLESFQLSAPDREAIPLGASGKVIVRLTRSNGFAGPVELEWKGLPDGVQPPKPTTLAADKTEATVELFAPASAPANASLATLVARGKRSDKSIVEQTIRMALATILKPPFKITPEGLDDVRKVRRGSTYLAPLLIERSEGFHGPIVLEMTAKQQRHRQGLASDEFTIEPGAKRIEYPIFVPEWMETTKTSRMILNGAVKLADGKGTLRTVLQRMELRIGILPEGSLMTLQAPNSEWVVRPGGELVLPFTLVRAPEFKAPARIEWIANANQKGKVLCDPIDVPPGETQPLVRLRFPDVAWAGEQTLLFRATATAGNKFPVASQTTVVVQLDPLKK